MQRAHEALARVHSTAGQQPVGAPVLLVAAEEDAPTPAEDRRHPDPRLGRHLGVRRAEAAHTALARRQLVDLGGLDVRERQDDELGDAHPRLDEE